MGESSLIDSVMPVFEAPETERFNYISKDYIRLKSEFLEQESVNDISRFENEFNVGIRSLTTEWNCRPKAFESIDSVNGYISHIHKAINFAKLSLDSASDRVAEIEMNKEANRRLTKKFNFFLNSISSILFLFIIYKYIYPDNGLLSLFLVEKEFDTIDNLGWPKFWAGVIVLFVGSMFCSMIEYIFDHYLSLNLKKKCNIKIELPDWMVVAKNDIEDLLNRIQSGKLEIIEDVERNKKLIQSIRERMIDEHFYKLSTAERIKMINAEAETARATATDLAEQHRLTEEVRLKYAKELIDLERKVKEENNQDLSDKLALVESLLSNGEIGHE